MKFTRNHIHQDGIKIGLLNSPVPTAVMTTLPLAKVVKHRYKRKHGRKKEKVNPKYGFENTV